MENGPTQSNDPKALDALGKGGSVMGVYIKGMEMPKKGAPVVIPAERSEA